MYTGIGGKVEENEDPQKGAERELLEETRIRAPLMEFGRLIVNDRKILHSFHQRMGESRLAHHSFYDPDAKSGCG